MRKFLRIGGIVVGGLILLLVLAYVGMEVYLSSGSAKRLASAQLSSLLGGNVRVTELDAGLGSTEVQVEVLPQAGPDGSVPVQPIVTGTVKANVSPLGLAAGNSPTSVTLENVKVTLHFDKDGNLTDKLPEPRGEGAGAEKIPTIHVKDAAVHLIQEGRPDFKISGVELSVAEEANRLKITGRADDPTWKAWKLSGDWAKDGSAGSLAVQTEAPVAVNPELLRSVPFVPHETWDWVVLTGTTPCTLNVSRGADKQIAYRVELTPAAKQLTVPPIDLTTTDTTGKVVVEGPKVTLTNVAGKTAGGTLHVDSVLDFRKEPSDLTFNIKAQGLDVRQLPKSWGLPQFDEGKLKGAADIELVVKDGKVEPHGRGEAELVGRLYGAEAEAKVRLVGDGKRLRFASDVNTSRRPPGRDLDAAAALLAMLLQAPTQPPATQPPAKTPATPAQPAQPTYVQANLRLRDVDLAELIKRTEVSVPIRITGKASLQVLAEIPITEARTIHAYRVRGTLTAPELGLQDLTLRDVTAEINLREGVLSLTKLSARVPTPDTPDGKPGSFVGTAKVGIDPKSDLTADLTIDSIPLGQVFKAVPDLTGLASGAVSGSVRLRAPADKLGDVTAYVADGSITAPALTAAGRRVERAAVKLDLKNGVARIDEASALIEGLPVTGTAAVTLTGKYPFVASVRTQPADVVAIKRLVPEARLPFDLTGKLATTADVKGTLSPTTFAASGTVTATGLVIGTAKVEKITVDWTADDDFVTLKNVRSDLYKGTITGSAKFPLKGNEAGAFDVTFKDVDAAAITRAVPSTPVKVEGQISGELKGTLPASGAGESRQATASLNLTAPRLRVQGIPAERLKGKIDYKPGLLGYDLTGETLGGSFDLNGTYPLSQTPPPKEEKKAGEQPVRAGPPAPQPDPPPPAAKGHVRLTGARLSQLADSLGVPGLAPLHGRVNLTLDYDFTPGAAGPTGGGLIELIDLGWGTSGDSTLRSAIRVTRTAIEVPDLGGRFAGGEVRGRLVYDLAVPARSYYRLTVDGADAAVALAPLGFKSLGARLHLDTRGNIGRELRGSGTVSFRRGKVTGFELAEVRLPFGWSHVPGVGGQLTVRDAGGQAAGGRVTGEATVSWGTTAQAQGRLRFVDLSFRALLGQFGQSSGLGSGRMNGQFTFSGTDMRSINDLKGQLTATLGEGPVFDLPVFSQIAQYVVPTVSARGLVQFNDGVLQGRLGGGQFHIDQLALTGAKAKLYMEGNVGLNGRLDLDVVAQTGQLGADPRVLRLLGIRIPAIGPIPVGLILEVTSYLSNRVVRARVTGTLDQPVVNINVTSLLTEGAIRYFLSPYLPLSQ